MSLANPVVLALPRGGVPVAVEIARKLHAPLDLLLVRKIGVPGQEEVALGAVVDGPQPSVFINEGIRRACGIRNAHLEHIKQRELSEIERRRALYLKDRAPVELEGATAILVDDGIATGATVRAALEGLRTRGAARLVIATGVASPDVVGVLESEVDDVVCLSQPQPLYGVGAHYEDFHQVPDQEVMDMLAEFA
jgi:putative phosphoribosyl transferase